MDYESQNQNRLEIKQELEEIKKLQEEILELIKSAIININDENIMRDLIFLINHIKEEIKMITSIINKGIKEYFGEIY